MDSSVRISLEGMRGSQNLPREISASTNAVAMAVSHRHLCARPYAEMQEEGQQDENKYSHCSKDGQDGEIRNPYSLWKKGQASQEDYKGVARLCRENIRRAKAELEVNLAAAVKGSKKHFFTYISSKRRAQENLQPLVDGEGTQ
ncbi:hypothetical protein QYF61_002555 [Mycteria americana]|uniref:Uncharacterized protein n=1 Tax=Mycteria americana TaxID=33587 RepID=A0AAN7RW18_MYCAM|nr:hypothetical protein QYF61_002555 [Mycteria americana]